MNPREILLIIVPIAVVALGAILYFCFTRKKALYHKRPSPMSDAENYFYGVLASVLPQGYELMIQLPLISALAASGSDRTLTGRILSKRFDYGIVHWESVAAFPYRVMVVDLAVELDDASHNRPERIRRDEFVNEICSTAHLPLLRVPCAGGSNPHYDMPALAKALRGLLSNR